MKLQVLISAMNCKPGKLLREMNLDSDAIIINQADKVGFEQFGHRGCLVKMFTFNERGVGLSRNSALMRAEAEICLIADDDVVYHDGYVEKILGAFRENPEADVIMFNLPSTNTDRPEYIIPKKERVRWYKSLRYGAFRIAFRNESIRKANVTFSLLFGGGARYMSGEDSLFVYDCLRKGLTIVAVPLEIGVVNHKESTWFTGYNEQFFHDKGALFRAMSPRLALLFTLYVFGRNRSQFKTDLSFRRIVRLAHKGMENYEKN